MKKGLFLCVLLLYALPRVALAQLKGTVTTSDASPAAYATVLLFEDSVTDGSPKAYAITDSKGSFNIKASHKTGNWIVVRYLGYKEYRKTLKAQDKTLNIRLEKDIQNLKTVTVAAERKSVEVSGDTIKFNTEYYKTGAEDNAAEVLNKIPGMEVNDNGEVSYGGKKVDKITIDGKDLFASGSDGALNTLSADAIQGAEILRNSRTGSIIDDFAGRELTTLNLKTDGRTRIGGKISAAGGIFSKYKSENSMLVTGKKLSLTGILSANNTGEAVFSINDYVQHIVGLDNLLRTGGKGFSFSEDELAMLMPPSNVYQSRNGIATLSGSWQPSDKLRVKGNIIANGTDVGAESLSQQEYFLLGLINSHRSASGNQNLFFSSQLQETWKPGDNIEFSSRTRYSRSRLLSDDTLSESGMGNLTTFENSGMDKSGIGQEMVLNAELGDNLLSAHLDISHTRRNHSYALLSNQALLPLSYYTIDAEGYTIDNSRQIVNTTVSPDVTYAIKLGHRFTLNTTLAFNHTRSSFRHTPQQGDSVAAHLGSSEATLAVELGKNKGIFRFTLGADAVAYLFQTDISQIVDRPQFSLLPQGSVTLAFSSAHRLSLAASLTRSPIELERLLPQTMVTGYNSIYGGSQITDPRSRSANVNLNYYIFDLFSNTLFYAAAGISENRFYVKPYSLQDSTILSTTRYNNDGRMQTQYVTGHLSKGLGSFPADIKLYATFSNTTSQTAVNSSEGEINSQSYNGSLSLVTRSKKAFNTEIGVSYATSTSQYNAIASISTTMHQYGAYGAAILTFKKFRGEVRYTFSHIENGSYSRDFNDISLRAEYRIKNWRILLRSSNMLYMDTMDWLSIASTALYNSTTQYRKVPGYLIAGLAYRF